jgi:hypothetical protein
MTAKLDRFAETYLMMASKARYRPQAPGDGCGGIYLSDEELRDRGRLMQEAQDYAIAFDAEEDTNQFAIGCSNFTTNRAFILAIEAARNLAGGADHVALKILEMAAAEVRAVIDERWH